MLTVPEVARRTGRNAETIRRWIRSGKLRAEKVGTQHLIDEDDLAAFVGHDRPQLPHAWRTFDDGVAQPDWDVIVTDQRRRR